MTAVYLLILIILCCLMSFLEGAEKIRTEAWRVHTMGTELFVEFAPIQMSTGTDGVLSKQNRQALQEFKIWFEKNHMRKSICVFASPSPISARSYWNQCPNDKLACQTTWERSDEIRHTLIQMKITAHKVAVCTPKQRLIVSERLDLLPTNENVLQSSAAANGQLILVLVEP